VENTLNPESFEQILNVKEDVEVNDANLRKCAANSELELVFIKSYHGDNEKKLICVNMVDRKVVFETPAYDYGSHTHHWLKKQNQHHLSVQSSRNEIKVFEVSDDGKQFTENKSLRITLADSDKINFCEFDKKVENVYLVKNGNILEQRTVSGDQGLVMSLNLEQSVSGTEKQLCLSDDGNWCAIASRSKYWYLVDNIQRKQFKLESKSLGSTYSPCFIGGGSERVVIGGNPKFEVWDINTRSSLQIVSGLGSYVNCTVSVGNIVAVGTGDKVLSLYDATTWNVIYSKKYEMEPFSLHLTADQKYLTVAGYKGELCVVLKLTN